MAAITGKEAFARAIMALNLASEHVGGSPMGIDDTDTLARDSDWRDMLDDLRQRCGFDPAAIEAVAELLEVFHSSIPCSAGMPEQDSYLLACGNAMEAARLEIERQGPFPNLLAEYAECLAMVLN